MKEYTIHSKDWISTVFENGKKKKKLKKWDLYSAHVPHCSCSGCLRSLSFSVGVHAISVVNNFECHPGNERYHIFSKLKT